MLDSCRGAGAQGILSLAAALGLLCAAPPAAAQE